MANLTKYKKWKTSEIVVDTLQRWGVRTIFGLPGDGINGIFEALRKKRDKIELVLVRHEESAAFMACAHAKYTGEIGACVATSGPGAIHLLNGLYDAKSDNTPVIAITGNTYSDLKGSDYQQDVNLLNLFSDVSEYNNMINSPEHAKMVTDIACRRALATRGVSHITIPIDVQEKKLSGSFSAHKVFGHTGQKRNSSIQPDLESIKRAAEVLNACKKPVLLVGQGATGAEDEVLELAKKLHAPIVKSLLGKAVVPDDDPHCIGGLGMLGTEPSVEAMSQTDVLLMVGTSFPYVDYLPKPGQARGIQIDIDPQKIGLRYPVDIGLVGDAEQTLMALNPLIKEKESSDFLKSKQDSMKKWRSKIRIRNRIADPIKPQFVASVVSDELDDDAIVSVDSGTNTVWAARYIQIKKGMKFSVSGTLASMACGLPYAIAAQKAFPKRQSVAFVGDGGFSMLMGEFATAVKYDLPIKIFIINNGSLGMIRWEQMAFLGNPEFAIDFSQIDFAKFAESCGGKGYTIKKSSQVKKVIREAMRQKKPTIINIFVDPYEPPMPPTLDAKFVGNLAESFVHGQPNKKRIGLTLFRNQLHEKFSFQNE